MAGSKAHLDRGAFGKCTLWAEMVKENLEMWSGFISFAPALHA